MQLNKNRLAHDDDEARLRYLRFFAAADQSADAAIWSTHFDGGEGSGRPWRRVVATASAEVFNNHSWDLWTQMWQAQLVPVGDLEEWLALMKRTGSVTEDLERLIQLPDSFSDDVGAIFRHLEDVAPLIEKLGEQRDPTAPRFGSGTP